MMPQSSVAEPINLGIVQLVIVESLPVLTQSAHSENEHNMAEQVIIQTVISSVEIFDGPKSKFESWTTSVENAAQITKHDVLCISFSGMIGP